jgi:hypothetical protein
MVTNHGEKQITYGTNQCIQRIFSKIKKTSVELDHCCYNNISTSQLKIDLMNYGLKENEFVIRSQESGSTGTNEDIQTVIEIKKTE